MALRGIANLPKLVKDKYASAKATGALTLAVSELAVLSLGGVPYQVRHCPSLAKKPTARKGNDLPKQPKPDPFANPDPSLLIAHFAATATADSPTHFLVLNKFPIIPNHFILATIGNKPQAQLLEEDDVWATYECIEHWEASDEHAGCLFAFFNSGEHSGASQAHRHVQFLPVEDMKHGDTERRWKLLLDQLGTDVGSQDVDARISRAHNTVKLPFQYQARSIPQDVQPDQLYQIYTDLYEAALGAAQAFANAYPQHLQLHSTEQGQLPISYNLAMTSTRMALCPRRSEGKSIKRNDGNVIDFVALNGTILGGTLMVKNAELFDLLKEDTSTLETILQEAGIPAPSTRPDSAL